LPTGPTGPAGRIKQTDLVILGWVVAVFAAALRSASAVRYWGAAAALRRRTSLENFDHAAEIRDGQPERPGAHTGLPDAEDGDSGVGVPAQPHAPRVASDIKEDLTQARQRRCVRHGNEAYRDTKRATCRLDDYLV
jgi:hypothetical protein